MYALIVDASIPLNISSAPLTTAVTLLSASDKACNSVIPVGFLIVTLNSLSLSRSPTLIFTGKYSIFSTAFSSP